MIDAHQHYWNLAAPWHEWPTAGLPAIHRDFAPRDLAPLLDECGIAGTIAVQAQPSDADTDWLLDLADRTPSMLGVVGWLDMIAADAPARIAALARRPKLKGVRPMLQDLPADWILRPEAADALVAVADHGLVFDALVRPAHLSAIDGLAARHPTLAIVIDHAAKPDIAARAIDEWAEGMAALARHGNVSCKLSGLVTEAGTDWSPERLAPYVAHLLASFGAARLVWGSDWPVVCLAADYRGWLETAQRLVPADMHAAVFGDNAARVYRLAGRSAGLA